MLASRSRTGKLPSRSDEGARPLEDVVELGVWSLAQALLDEPPGGVERVALIGYTDEERRLLSEVGKRVASEMDDAAGAVALLPVRADGV